MEEATGTSPIEVITKQIEEHLTDSIELLMNQNGGKGALIEIFE